MSVYVANIDVNNLNRLEKASQEASVRYETGVFMTFSENMDVKFSFVPIFCSSVEEGDRLLTAYVKSAVATDNLDELRNDLIPRKGGIAGYVQEIVKARA